MWKYKQPEIKNYAGVRQVRYYCDDQDLGIKKVSARKQRQRDYHKIFQASAQTNMTERLQNFSQFQSQLKQ